MGASGLAESSNSASKLPSSLREPSSKETATVNSETVGVKEASRTTPVTGKSDSGLHGESEDQGPVYKALKQVGVDVGDGNLANVNGLPIHAFMGSTARSSMAGAVATTARFGRCLGCAVKKRVQSLGNTFKRAPTTWAIPLACLALMLSLGVWGTHRAAEKQREHDIEIATAAAEGVAKSFELQLQSSYAPCVTLATLVELQPYWPELNVTFHTLAPNLMAQVPTESLSEIQFAPLGIITESFPPDPAAAGRNLFKEETRRAIALETVALGTLTLAGPLKLFRGDLGLVARIPIFLENQPFNATYGMDEVPQRQVFENYNWKCDQCYNTTTRRKFWGFSIAIILWDRVTGPKSQLAQLTNQGYHYKLVQPDPNNPGVNITITNSVVPPPADARFVTAVIKTRGPNAPKRNSKSFTDEWYLKVVPENGWTPSWRNKAIGGVVAGSFVVAALICAVLVNRMQHITALEDLKVSNAQLAETTHNLQEEKQRLDALLVRQYNLINMFDAGNLSKSERAAGADDSSLASSNRISREGSAVDRIEALRRTMVRSGQPNSLDDPDQQLTTMEMLGEGTFGKVYKGLWRGTMVAIKTLVLPANMSGAEKREKMAIMEAAISSSLSHPNIVQTYTYMVKPLRDGVGNDDEPLDPSLIIGQDISTMGATSKNTVGKNMHSSAKGSMTASNSKAIHSYEVRLILEYCDKGNLRDAIDQGAFFSHSGLNYRAILDTAGDIAKAMLHLHASNVLHGDLKARNVLLKSSGSEGRGLLAKVGDFGLSIKMDHMETHISAVFQGTLTHMAPEIMLEGHVSKAADVYAFGITLYELFTGGHPFKGVPKALLGHQITKEARRPKFPPITPAAFVDLAERCWAPSPNDRPSFEEILTKLSQLRDEIPGGTDPLYIEVKLPGPEKLPQVKGAGEAPAAGAGAAKAAEPNKTGANPAPAAAAGAVASGTVALRMPGPGASAGGATSGGGATPGIIPLGPSDGSAAGQLGQLNGGTLDNSGIAIIIGDGDSCIALPLGSGKGGGGSVARSFKGVPPLPRIEEGSDRREGRASSDVRSGMSEFSTGAV